MRFREDVVGVPFPDGEQRCYEAGDVDEVPVPIARQLIRDQKAEPYDG